jgi:MFS family permease
MAVDIEQRPVRPPPPPSWSSIPNKFQLALICSVRIVDFFQQAAIQAYMFYQLKSFSPDAPDTEISFQSGVLQGVFTLAQVFTGILWGRVADSPAFGRKWVVIIGLTGQGVSCMGVAFSRSFTSAVVWRCLGGAVNATVGGARTALAESTEKKYHSRTFLLLPLAWNIANIFGPIFGGLFSDPVQTYPGLFAENSTFGGRHGIAWLRAFPYAPPNLMCAVVLFADALAIWLGLRETLISIKFNRDRGVECGENLVYAVRRALFQRFGYNQLSQSEAPLGPDSVDDMEEPASTSLTPLTPNKEFAAANKPSAPSSVPKAAPPLTQALTVNVLMVLATVAFMDFQMGGFASLWTIFLSSSPRTKEEAEAIRLPFHFAGGIGFSPSTIGIAMSILGFVGIFLQFTLYPGVNARYGLLKSTRWSLFVFPIAYALAPYLSLMVYQPIALWFSIVLVVVLQVGSRTFAIPGVVLLTNNASPSPALLGTIHGMGAATSSAFRTLGPIVAGHWYGQGVQKGMTGYAWWCVALVSLVGIVPSFWAKDGR